MNSKLTGLLGILAFFILWQAAAMLLRTPIVPTPVQAFATLAEMFYPDIFQHLAISLYRIAVAMAISVAIGVPGGILMGYFKPVDAFLSPLTHMLYPLPKIALLPIIMVMLGIGDKSKILMMVLIIVFQIIITVKDAVKAIPVEYYLPYYAVDVRFKGVLSNIILPASLPGILTALKNSFGAAVSVLFFAESYGTTYGMGFFISDAWMRVNYKQMFAGILALGIMGVAVYFLIEYIETAIIKYIK